MRAERRHELETNELADYLGRLLRDYNLHLKVGGIILAALLVGLLVYRLLATSEARRAARAWEAFMIAREPEDYERIIRDYEGLPASYWAMLELADLEYSRGLDRLTQDREEAETYIKKALERYRRALEVASEVDEIDPAFGARALLGQAHCYEALGDRNKAIETYERLLKEYPDTWMAQRAEQRLAELKKPGAAEFYAALLRAAASLPKNQLSPGTESLLPPVPSQTGSSKPPQNEQPAQETGNSEASGAGTESAAPSSGSTAPEQREPAGPRGEGKSPDQASRKQSPPAPRHSGERQEKPPADTNRPPTGSEP